MKPSQGRQETGVRPKYNEAWMKLQPAVNLMKAAVWFEREIPFLWPKSQKQNNICTVEGIVHNIACVGFVSEQQKNSESASRTTKKTDGTGNGPPHRSMV